MHLPNSIEPKTELIDAALQFVEGQTTLQVLRQLSFHIRGKNEIRFLSQTIHQINSRCFKDLNSTYETFKLLKDLRVYFYSLKQGKERIGRRALQAEEIK